MFPSFGYKLLICTLSLAGVAVAKSGSTVRSEVKIAIDEKGDSRSVEFANEEERLGPGASAMQVEVNERGSIVKIGDHVEHGGAFFDSEGTHEPRNHPHRSEVSGEDPVLEETYGGGWRHLANHNKKTYGGGWPETQPEASTDADGSASPSSYDATHPRSVEQAEQELENLEKAILRAERAAGMVPNATDTRDPATNPRSVEQAEQELKKIEKAILRAEREAGMVPNATDTPDTEEDEDNADEALDELEATAISNALTKKRFSPSPPPVDCVWGEWQDQSRCSTTCGPGFQTRKRDVKQKAAHKGKQCEGEDSKVVECTVDQECPMTTTTFSYTMPMQAGAMGVPDSVSSLVLVGSLALSLISFVE